MAQAQRSPVGVASPVGVSRRPALLSPALAALVALAAGGAAAAVDFPLVDTAQTLCYDEGSRVVPCPATGSALAGQDAQHVLNAPSLVDNDDGTVTDLITGLTWERTPGPKLTWADAMAGASAVRTGGHSDWRVPTIKELYSLMRFDGVTGRDAASSTPYLDTDSLDFEYGDTSAGERFIDAQYWSSTSYVATTMNGDPTAFGVNFADGRIKGYPKVRPTGEGFPAFVRHVRGPVDYGVNDFVDGGDGTVTDLATGLQWTRADAGDGMDWPAALAWVEARNAEGWLGHDDWRLPDAKELQSLVDYTRAPATDGTAAIDPIFDVTALPDGELPFYWTSTTHLDGPPDVAGGWAVYVAFGRALGWMEVPPGSGNRQLLDVHGAGAQRSDPKTGDAADHPFGHGPQGDVVRVTNAVRLVRGGAVVELPPNVLRNDETSARDGAGALRPAIFAAAGDTPGCALDALGADRRRTVGEGAALARPGSADDDDFYAMGVTPGWTDPDEAVAGDATRPLVYYELDTDVAALRVTLADGLVRLDW